MASRPELLQIALELGVEGEIENLSLEEMVQEIRHQIDKKFDKKYLVSPNRLSNTLLKFMTEEFDYYLVSKDNKRHNYKGEPIK